MFYVVNRIWRFGHQLFRHYLKRGLLMTSHELLRLIEEVEFRLEMGKAVGSEHPLPVGILRKLVLNPEFSRLYSDMSAAVGADAAKEIPLLTEDPVLGKESSLRETNRKIFQRLGENECVRLLILESVDAYNQHLSVLAGFRRYLETAISEKPHPPSPGESGEKIPDHPISPKRLNPILNMALVALLGSGTAVPPVIAYKALKEPAPQSIPNKTKKDPLPTPTPLASDEAKVQEEVARRVKEIIDVTSKLLPREIKITDGRCGSCSAPAGALNGTVSLQFKQTPEIKVTTAGPLVSLFNSDVSAKSLPNAQQQPAEFTVNLKLTGIPEPKPFPSALTLSTSQTPNYRVESLPASFVVADPTRRGNAARQPGNNAGNVNASSSTSTATTKKRIGPYHVKLVLPVSYETAATCDLVLWIEQHGSLLSGDVKQCASKTPPQILGNHFEMAFTRDSAWHFIPEIGAMAKVEQHGTGFLGMGQKVYNITVQAVPFSKPEPALPANGSSQNNNTQTSSVQTGKPPLVETIKGSR
jgi:hypothetical protein